MPLVINGRQMVYAAVNGFHSQTLAYEWDPPDCCRSVRRMVACSGEDGIVLHSLSWAPLLARLRSDRGPRYLDVRSVDARWGLSFQKFRRHNAHPCRPDSDEFFFQVGGRSRKGG